MLDPKLLDKIKGSVMGSVKSIAQSVHSKGSKKKDESHHSQSHKSGDEDSQSGSDS